MGHPLLPTNALVATESERMMGDTWMMMRIFGNNFSSVKVFEVPALMSDDSNDAK